jgi:hypothetical protein
MSSQAALKSEMRQMTTNIGPILNNGSREFNNEVRLNVFAILSLSLRGSKFISATRPKQYSAHISRSLQILKGVHFFFHALGYRCTPTHCTKLSESPHLPSHKRNIDQNGVESQGGVAGLKMIAK